jgi:hypothetical protein
MSLVRIKDYPRMGAMIFGEGVINDALSIVLFKTFLPIHDAHIAGELPDESNILGAGVNILGCIFYQLIMSCVIGITCGLANAKLLHTFSFTKHHPIHQVCVCVLVWFLIWLYVSDFWASAKAMAQRLWGVFEVIASRLQGLRISIVSWLRSDCKVDAMRLQSGCNAIAKWLQCDCKVDAMRLQSGCSAIAKWMQCDCKVVAMRLQSGCNAIAKWLRIDYESIREPIANRLRIDS